jgi:hypothetical protein
MPDHERSTVMEFSSVVLDAEIQRQELSERIARARTPKIPASAHRHLLAQRLHRIADRVDN